MLKFSGYSYLISDQVVSKNTPGGAASWSAFVGPADRRGGEGFFFGEKIDSKVKLSRLSFPLKTRRGGIRFRLADLDEASFKVGLRKEFPKPA